MNISEIKDLLAQFDASTLREFSYKNNGEELNLSKNQTSSVAATPVAPAVEVVAAPQTPAVAPVVEAMKVMNEVPAPKDGVVTEILVTNEEMVEFGKGLVRIK